MSKSRLGKIMEFLGNTPRRIQLKIRGIDWYLGLDAGERQKFNLKPGEIVHLLEKAGKETVEEFLDQGRAKEFGLNGYCMYLIDRFELQEKYIKHPEKLKTLGMSEFNISNFIMSNRNKVHLTLDSIKELGLDLETLKTIFNYKPEEHLDLLPEEAKELGFDALKFVIRTEKIEEYLTPEKLIELGIGGISIEWLKGKVNIEKFLFEGQDKDDSNLVLKITNFIKATGNEKEYLKLSKIRELNLSKEDVKELMIKTGTIVPETLQGLGLRKELVYIIGDTGKIVEYLTPEKAKELGLSSREIFDLMEKNGNNIKEYKFDWQNESYLYDEVGIANLIKFSGKIEKYLTPEKVQELGISKKEITALIKETGNIEKYLLDGQDKNDPNLKLGIANLIKFTGKIEEYLTPEQASKYRLNRNDITELIKENGNIEKYLIEGQDKNDPNLKLGIGNLIKVTGNEKVFERYQKLKNKNDNIDDTIYYDFIANDELYNSYTEEQLLRITNYPEVQEFILKYSGNKYINEILKETFENDSNWIISLSKVMDNIEKYPELMENLENEKNQENTKELLEILSSEENYFDIKTPEDVRNYREKKNSICKKILENGKIDKLPDGLNSQYYTKDELYKFALLEYKFGISLEEAKRITERYGEDAEKMDRGPEADYLKILKEIVEHENIENVVKLSIKSNTLDKEWMGFPNARNAEADIINYFAKLYNETLYKPKEIDRKTEEIYIDKEGEEYKVDVYEIVEDFNMNIRVEGAYAGFSEPEDFADYFNTTDISYHGNCESYIGNDSIATAIDTDGVMVGYDMIEENQLIGSLPADIGSATDNMKFSSYGMESQFLSPQEMINNTRHTHNEMVKERLKIDKNGNVIKYKPSYAVWIEETPKNERNAEWKEARENDAQWKMTKKLAAQMGIPIVVIDREKFAEKETEKLEAMQKILRGESVDEKKYGKYTKLSKPELVKQMIIKFENNRIGIQFKEKMHDKFFTQEQFENLYKNIEKDILMLPTSDKNKCFEILKQVLEKEVAQGEIYGDEKLIEEKTKMHNFCEQEIENLKKKIANRLDAPSISNSTKDLIQKISATDYYKTQQKKGLFKNDSILELYVTRQTTFSDINYETQTIKQSTKQKSQEKPIEEEER